MSSCIQQITITNTILVNGSLGSTKYFIKNDQYCFTEIVRMQVDCKTCDASYKHQMLDYFVVEIDGEIFNIPETDAVHDATTIPAKFKNPHAYWEDYNKQPADWKKAYKELTGIDVTKSEQAIYNGEELAKKLRGKSSE